MGRPRQFDVQQALDAALCVFWRKGYEGATYSDLTEATGVERPALYAAFGNKEALFLKALERYYERDLDFFRTALKQPTSREVVAQIFSGAAELHTRHPEHRGCLGINGALAVSDEAEPVQRALIESRAASEALLRERLARAREEGDLPPSADPAVLAAFVCAVVHGMAVQGKAGFSHEMLKAIGEQALSTWPASPKKRTANQRR